MYIKIYNCKYRCTHFSVGNPFHFCTSQNAFYRKMATLEDIGEISQEEISSEEEDLDFVMFYEGIITIIIIGG